MVDLLLPATDGGVAIQALGWAALTIIGIALTRRHKDHRLLVIGLSTLTLGVMAVRAVH